MNLLRAIILLFFCTAFSEARAQQQDRQEPSNKNRFLGFRSLKDTVNDEKSGVFILPLLYYTPDTRWAYGAAGVYYFRATSDKPGEPLTRMSNVQFLADYTQNKQLDIWGLWNIFTKNENFLFKGEARYRNFPDRFYGIGNRTSKEQVEKYSYNLLSLKNLVLKKIRPSLFAGLDYHIEKEYGFTYTENGILESGTVRGYKGSIGSALGLVALYDSRDNVINTYKGRSIELSSYFYRPAIGSTFPFTYLHLMYQDFFQIGRKKGQILAIQAKIRYGFGQVPFLDMSTAGNDDLLRGYAKNRFRDLSFAGAQAEYRFPLFWRFGAVTFAGIGDVFSKPSDLCFDCIKYSVGAGLRFVINPAERLNLRLDYGYGREGGYFYFMVAESF